MNEPDIAVDYDDRGARAAHAVLVELGQVLGAHREAIVVVGGLVPSLLMQGLGHIGTLDIDLDLNPEKLADHGYADLVDKLLAAGYERGLQGMKPFQIRRTVELKDGGVAVAVIVDLLMPKGAKTQRHRPPLIQGLRVQEADGGDVALRHNIRLVIEGVMPDGRSNRVEMLVASIPALLVMKGYALVQRDKKKDAYDIYFSIRNYQGGLGSLADECRPLLDDPVAREGLANIADKFARADGFGPATVRMFLEGTAMPEGMTSDQVQQDAFRQVQALLQGLGLSA
jgi:hypothetical protein